MWQRQAARRLASCAAGAVGGGFATRLARSESADDTTRTRRRLAVGGVQDEFKQAPSHTVCRLDPPLRGFFSKEVRACGVPIRAHECVSDAALAVAADRLSRMLRHMPSTVLERLERRGAALHVIGVRQGVSSLPEHAHMKGVDGGYTGEKGITLDQRARGMGGVLSSCGEENLLECDTDPRYAGRDILVHEFAHCLMDAGGGQQQNRKQQEEQQQRRR